MKKAIVFAFLVVFFFLTACSEDYETTLKIPVMGEVLSAKFSPDQKYLGYVERLDDRANYFRLKETKEGGNEIASFLIGEKLATQTFIIFFSDDSKRVGVVSGNDIYNDIIHFLYISAPEDVRQVFPDKTTAVMFFEKETLLLGTRDGEIWELNVNSSILTFKQLDGIQLKGAVWGIEQCDGMIMAVSGEQFILWSQHDPNPGGKAHWTGGIKHFGGQNCSIISFEGLNEKLPRFSMMNHLDFLEENVWDLKFRGFASAFSDDRTGNGVFCTLDVGSFSSRKWLHLFRYEDGLIRLKIKAPKNLFDFRQYGARIKMAWQDGRYLNVGLSKDTDAGK